MDFDVILKRKWFSRFCKRAFDICSSFLGLIILLPFFVIFAIMVATTSKGGVFFKQERIGRNGKPFKIIKFRTMTKNAESVGMQITVGQDMRITKVGKFLRATKIDELPQLFNVLFGQMSFVGARPEVPKYVAMYSDYEKNILKIRPGITELSSIVYRDEASALAEAECPEYMYVNEIMTKKLEYNLDYIEKLGLCYDIKLIFKTLIAIVKD
ncbi:MAG: sugar transferase [Clostridia bacterium]